MCGASAVSYPAPISEVTPVPTVSDVETVPGSAIVEVAPVKVRSHNAVDALIKRVNRKLASITLADGGVQKLRKSTPKQAAKRDNDSLGAFYLTNSITGAVMATWQSLEEFARRFGFSTEGIEFNGHCGYEYGATNVA